MKKLTLKLYAEEDDDLRIYVKQLISEQVKAIVRSELDQIIRDTLVDKVSAELKPEGLGERIDNVIGGYVRAELLTPGSSYGRTYIQDVAREEVSRIIGMKLDGIKFSNV